jgi:hypothetical protein
MHRTRLALVAALMTIAVALLSTGPALAAGTYWAGWSDYDHGVRARAGTPEEVGDRVSVQFTRKPSSGHREVRVRWRWVELGDGAPTGSWKSRDWTVIKPGDRVTQKGGRLPCQSGTNRGMEWVGELRFHKAGHWVVRELTSRTYFRISC